MSNFVNRNPFKTSPGGTDCKMDVQFPREFKAVPVVLPLLRSFDLRQLVMDVEILNVTKSAFQIRAFRSPVGDITLVKNVVFDWVAIEPSDEKEVRVQQGTQKITDQTKTTNAPRSGEIKFVKPFKNVPIVAAFISIVNTADIDNVRVSLQVVEGSVSKESFKWSLISWDGSATNSITWSWIAYDPLAQ